MEGGRETGYNHLGRIDKLLQNAVYISVSLYFRPTINIAIKARNRKRNTTFNNRWLQPPWHGGKFKSLQYRSSTLLASFFYFASGREEEQKKERSICMKTRNEAFSLWQRNGHGRKWNVKTITTGPPTDELKCKKGSRGSKSRTTCLGLSIHEQTYSNRTAIPKTTTAMYELCGASWATL